MIKVRFAPSPTGYLHIGGARTALFNWMYAKNQGGIFVLRIEDTDKVRSRQEYLEEILDSMTWLGMAWDELYKQSDRFDIYKEHADVLVKEGKAYLDGSAVILKMPKQEVKLFDLIRGEIIFDTETLKDEVLLKSDGSPTYSFACAVDDSLMDITHVIRGEDHISNTPKQMMIYQALNKKPPKYAHLPLIMDAEGGRMSKRSGAVAVSEYRRLGFLPEALLNYLLLLGWSPGNNQEVIPMASAIKNFSIKKINKAAAAFSLEKFKWINAQYIKTADEHRILEVLMPALKEKGWIKEDISQGWLLSVVHQFKGRMATLQDFLERADYLFLDEVSFEDGVCEQYLSQDLSKEFHILAEELAKLEHFDAKATEEVFRTVVAKAEIESSLLVHPVRVALTGKAVGIGLFETMALLGKDKTRKRLNEAFKRV